MVFSKELNEVDFVVVNRIWTEKDRAQISRAVSECRTLSESLRGQGYSPEEIHERLNARFTDETGSTKKPRRPKTAAAPAAIRRKRRDNAALTA